ncbi:MAG: tetratricopeptide repeat protein, partial [Acidobacteriota bacterium]|nr:tetratricopeptide repeat protein [Acidobacteriota bacterium]
FSNIFVVQDMISAQVARALALALTGEEQERLRKRYTENTEAYQAYLKGRYFLTGPGNNQRTKEGIEKAGEYFKQAIAIDPAYALAYVGLADYYITTNYYVALPSKEAGQVNLQRARALILKALEMDEELAEAHATLGGLLMDSGPDWSGVEKEYKRALELNPNYAVAHHHYAGYLGWAGRIDESLAMIKRAQELDPLSPMITRTVGGAYWQQRRFEEAVREYRKAVELEPNFWPAYESMAMAYSHIGKHEEAIAAALKAREITKGNLESTYILGRTYGLAGRKEETLKILDEMNERSQREIISPIAFAIVYQALGGEEERVLNLLEKSYEEGWLTLLSFKYDPLFDGLHSHPQFQAMMRRVDPFSSEREIQGR